MPQQGQTSDGGHRAAGWLSKAQWCQVPSTPESCAASVAMVHGPSGVAASCGQGGARVGGGGRSPGGEGARVRTQQPNKGVQATASSLQSIKASCRLCGMQHLWHDNATSLVEHEIC